MTKFFGRESSRKQEPLSPALSPRQRGDGEIQAVQKPGCAPGSRGSPHKRAAFMLFWLGAPNTAKLRSLFAPLLNVNSQIN